jgi:hypothetical protein
VYSKQKPVNSAFTGFTSCLSFRLIVGKTERTVLANEIEIQYVIIIGGALLTYLLRGTDRLERAIVKEMNYRLVYSVIKDTKSSSRRKKL